MSMKLTPRSGSADERLSTCNRRTLLKASAMIATFTLSPCLMAGVRAGAGEPLVPVPAARRAGAGDTGINVLRALLLATLTKVPTIGAFLTSLGNLFIPLSGQNPEDLWRRYTDARISDTVMALVKADLAGLSEVIVLYREAIRGGNLDTIKAQSIACRTVFAQRLPQFKLAGHEGELLPVFVQAATLQLALLKDMASTGKQIGLVDADIAAIKRDITARISEYQRHVDTFVAEVIDKVRRDNPNDSVPKKRNQPLSAVLEKTTELQLSVNDIRDTWYAFDVEKFPNGTSVELTREVFTPIIGWWDAKSTPPNQIPDWKAPGSAIRSLEIWNKSQWRTSFLSAFKVNYEDGTEVTTGRMAGTRTEINLRNRSVTRLVAVSSSGIGALVLGLADGGVEAVGRDPEEVIDRTLTSNAPKGHRLSSLRSVGEGRNAAEKTISGFIAGYQLIESKATPLSLECFDEVAPGMPLPVLEWLTS